jgi:hypothetical protein
MMLIRVGTRSCAHPTRLVTAFEQFPGPPPPLVTIIRAGDPCVGLLGGVLIALVLGRKDA